jgi:Flavin containing amine oxidoreductase
MKSLCLCTLLDLIRQRCLPGHRLLPQHWRECPFPRAFGPLSLLPIQGTQCTVEDGKLSREESQDPLEAELHRTLQELKDDLTVTEFLRRHFAGPKYDWLRHSIERMVEGYDAADSERASTVALRDEWMNGGRSTQARIAGGYGALVEFLTAVPQPWRCDPSELSRLRHRSEQGKGVVRCANGDAHEYDAVVLTVPLPLLKEIVLPPAERERADWIAPLVVA